MLSYWGTEVSINHDPRQVNLVANEIAQIASGAHIQERKSEENVEVQRRTLPSNFEKGFNLDVMTKEPEIEDWMTLIIQYLKDHFFPISKKIRQQPTKFVMWDKTLLRKTPDGFLLKCLGLEKSIKVMAEVYEGICEAHQSGTKVRWLL